jgi:CRP-like cAMP-binding protein
VATVIKTLFDKYGNRESHRIELSISREELAGYAGIATESLIRTLSDFKSENLISNEGKTIVIEDYDKLSRISMGGV